MIPYAAEINYMIDAKLFPRRKSHRIWMEVIRRDIEAKGLSEGILLDRNEWKKLIHVPDPA